MPVVPLVGEVFAQAQDENGETGNRYSRHIEDLREEIEA